MNPVMRRWSSRLWWLVPVLACGLLLGFELGWGRQVHRLPEPAPVIEARAVTPTLLPEYKIEGGLAGRAETVSRTLFNPTRRPAPAAAASDAGRTQMPRGQFILMGTTLAGERNIAFLKEVAGGKARTVRQGEQINGMLVAEVKPDRVRFTLGSESEEVVMKLAVGPKTTANPTPAAPGTPGAPPAQQAGVAPALNEGAQLVQQRRRAAQAAAAAEVVPAVPALPRNALIPGTPAAGQGTPASGDPNWNDAFERMRPRGQQSK